MPSIEVYCREALNKAHTSGAFLRRTSSEETFDLFTGNCYFAERIITPL